MRDASRPISSTLSIGGNDGFIREGISPETFVRMSQCFERRKRPRDAVQVGFGSDAKISWHRTWRVKEREHLVAVFYRRGPGRVLVAGTTWLIRSGLAENLGISACLSVITAARKKRPRQGRRWFLAYWSATDASQIQHAVRRLAMCL